MTNKQYRDLKNHLETLACTTCVWTPEYKNLCKRIGIIWGKLESKEYRSTPIKHILEEVTQ